MYSFIIFNDILNMANVEIVNKTVIGELIYFLYLKLLYVENCYMLKIVICWKLLCVKFVICWKLLCVKFVICWKLLRIKDCQVLKI